jgi:hypothetical protein
MSRKKLSRNAPCPCGSGKKYKHCCYAKDIEDDLSLGAGQQQPQYPIGTVALYGPNDKTTTKIAAGVILHDGAEPIMKRWVATDVMNNPKVQQEMKDFFHQHGDTFSFPLLERGQFVPQLFRCQFEHIPPA